MYKVFADHVEVDGVSYPRCHRAVGIARCDNEVREAGELACDVHAR